MTGHTRRKTGWRCIARHDLRRQPCAFVPCWWNPVRLLQRWAR